MEMFVVHDKERLKIIYIEYQGRRPFSVIAAKDNYCRDFDFEKDAIAICGFMYYHSGSGGSIKNLQPPHYIKGSKASYWMHPDAKFRKGKGPINCKRRKKPMKFNGNSNPFENGREVYAVEYCKFCKKYYDENYCHIHHEIINGELQYVDGSKPD